MKILKIAISAVVFALVLVGALYFSTVSEPKQNWVVSGGEAGGKYDEVARALGDAMAEEFAPKVRVDISSGSRQNLDRLLKGQADLCLVQNDVTGEKGIRSIATLYKEVLHVVVRKDTTSPEQLSNGTFSIGPSGGGTESLAVATLVQMGFSEEKITWRNESLEQGLQALGEKRADAVCIVTGIGNATVRKFLSEGNFTLLDLGNDIFESVRYSYPFARPASIPSLSPKTRSWCAQPANLYDRDNGASCVPTRPCGKPCLRASPFPRAKPGEPDPGATALRSNGFTRDYRPTAIRPSRWGPTALRKT